LALSATAALSLAAYCALLSLDSSPSVVCRDGSVGVVSAAGVDTAGVHVRVVQNYRVLW